MANVHSIVYTFFYHQEINQPLDSSTIKKNVGKLHKITRMNVSMLERWKILLVIRISQHSFHILIRYSCVTIIMIHNHKNKNDIFYDFPFPCSERILKGQCIGKKCLILPFSLSLHFVFPIFFFQRNGKRWNDDKKKNSSSRKKIKTHEGKL